MAVNDTTRIVIHAGVADHEIGQHPEWRNEQNIVLEECVFSTADEDGTEQLDGKAAMEEINSRLERVLDKAPSDASADLVLRKTRDGYRAFFKIRSAHKKFGGMIRGRRLLDVVDRVFNQVRGQIDTWKEKRELATE